MYSFVACPKGQSFKVRRKVGTGFSMGSEDMLLSGSCSGAQLLRMLVLAEVRAGLGCVPSLSRTTRKHGIV